MKNNYPIKYAVMPIIEAIGWNHGLNSLERSYDKTCNIISKCFVVAEKTRYKANGTNEKTYEVVFPYQLSHQKYNELEREEPEYNYYSQCTNSDIVNEVFDDFESAKIESKRQNDELFIKNVTYIPFDDNYHETMNRMKNEFYNKVNQYEIYEEVFEQSTEDLIVNNKPHKQEIILLSEDKDKVLNTDLYEFMNIYQSSFIVCNVTEEDFNKMKQQIKETGILDEKLSDPDVDYDMFNYILGREENSDVIRIKNNYDELKGSKYIDKNKNINYDEKLLSFDKDPSFKKTPKTLKIYTTETIEDVIKSFASNYVNLNKIKQKK